MQSGTYQSPVGVILISATRKGISALQFINDQPAPHSTHADITACKNQLDQYFAGKRTVFDLRLDLSGTDFQLAVWNELINIPYGKTISYMQLAKRLGNPKSIRAAARASAQNPVPVLVPCHRVIGSNGNLTGYAGGLWRKKWLIEHETTEKQQTLF